MRFITFQDNYYKIDDIGALFLNNPI